MQQRSKRFASLRAAQRALSSLTHPRELERSIEQGRELLVALQSLSNRATEASDDANAGWTAGDRATLANADGLLDQLSTAIRAVLDEHPISQLRPALQLQASQHPGEILGVVEVMLEGDIESNKNLRLIEYLMTRLCSAVQDETTSVTRDPGDVAPNLARLAEALWGPDDAECAAAEVTIRGATAKVLRAESVGQVRDSIRDFKRNLRTRVLHPKVLSAVIHYNVAMSNRVAGLMKGSRSIDFLAADLLIADAESGSSSESNSLFDSKAFARLSSALRARILGTGCEDDLATRVAARFDVGGITPEEIEAFSTDSDGHAEGLIRAAVTLGLIVRNQSKIEAELTEVGIDAVIIRSVWARELAREMTAVARKILAEARYSEASRLSEIRARNLAFPAAADEPRRAVRAPSDPPEMATASMAGGTTASAGGDPGLMRLATLAAAVLLFGIALWSISSTGDVWSHEKLAAVSNHIESGYVSQRGDSARFIGTLGISWDALDPAARRQEAAKMGSALEAQRIDRGVLIDRRDRVLVRIHEGTVVHVSSGNESGT